MKQLRLSTLLLLFTTLMFSCKKSDTPVNWNDRLKNTVWSGEFAYTAAGFYAGTQPFSVVLAEDGTITWSDMTSTRPAGSYTCVDDKITVTFPNNTKFSAKVAEESWSGFVSEPGTGVDITYLKKSVRPTLETISGSSYRSTVNGAARTIKFLDATKLEYTIGGGSGSNLDYAIEGGGVRFWFTGIVSRQNFYAIFDGNFRIMRGIEVIVSGIPPKTNYFSWTANKLQL